MQSPFPLRVHAISYAAEGVLLFDLRPPAGGELPGFEPGAHVDVHLPAGLVRSYSLCNDASERHRYLIGVSRDAASRGGSAWLHESARAGSLLDVSAPRNNFQLREDAVHSVLLAGGIGITPIWSMVQRLERLRKPWTLHYGCTSRRRAAFLGELARAFTMGQVHVALADQGTPRLDLEAIVRKAPEGAHLYCCGPAGMIAGFQQACSGLPAERVHLEHFAAVARAPGRGDGFTVRLARSGREFFVAPERSILETLEQAGISVPSSCREGLCGACETRVLSGTPDHRDLMLSEAERAAGLTMMVCCSRAKSVALELDL